MQEMGTKAWIVSYLDRIQIHLRFFVSVSYLDTSFAKCIVSYLDPNKADRNAPLREDMVESKKCEYVRGLHT